MFNIAEEEWLLAKKIQKALSSASSDIERTMILSENNHNGIVLGQLGSATFHREHTITSNDEKTSIGIKGLTHNFISINQTLFVIGNSNPETMLGAGKFGQVFLGINEDGKTCAIKIENLDNHSANEVAALNKMGYLQGIASIKDKFYTLMDIFPGKSLMLMHKKGKVSDPYLEAAKQLNYTQQSMNNLKTVKKDFLDYDCFDDDDYYSSICAKMSKDEKTFSLSDLKALKLRAKAVESKNQYTLKEKLQFAISAAEQVKKVFDQGIMHRDIKGDNFVGKINAEGVVEVAIVDFGGAIELDNANKNTQLFGSPKYMANEVISCLDQNKHSLLGTLEKQRIKPQPFPLYSKASDVFSYSIMCGYDFGLPPDSGFGILKLAQNEQAVDRPTIEEITVLLKIELALKNENITNQELNNLLTDIEDIPTSNVITVQVKQSLLSKVVENELKIIKDRFTHHYKSTSPLQSNGFFFSSKQRRSDIEEKSLKEIIENAEKPHLFKSEKRIILQEKGYLDDNYKRANLIEKLLKIEEQSLVNDTSLTKNR